MNEQDQIMVSVVIPTYNHEAYIEQAIDSVLMQKTQYSMEILVGEDKSTDNTKRVLQEYEKKHPGKIKVYYRERNLSCAMLENAPDLRRKALGKYIITLEGDDFWTDINKIEIQVNFLEEHPEYVAVSHLCEVVDENGECLDEEYPSCKDEEYNLNYYLDGIYPGQLATVLCRNFCKEKIFDSTILERHLSPGDKILYFALVTNGKVKCIQKSMSAYRHVRKRGTSYSANYKYDFFEDEHWYSELLSFSKKQKKGVRCIEALYLGCLIHGVKEKAISLRKAAEYIDNIDDKFIASMLFLKRMLDIRIFGKGKVN